MRLALLLLALPAFGQIGVIMEPRGEDSTETLMGLKKHTAWAVTVTCPPGAQSFYRQDVVAATQIAELTHTESKDLLEKAQTADARGLGAKATGLLVKAGGAALTGAGVVSTNPYMVAGGLAITFGDGAKGVLEGVAVKNSQYIERLLPSNDNPIPCRDGRGGEYLVITGKVKDPKRVEVGSVVAPTSVAPVSYLEAFPGCNCVLSTTVANTQVVHLDANPPASTHPMVDEPVIYDTARVAAMIQERSAARGAVE